MGIRSCRESASIRNLLLKVISKSCTVLQYRHRRWHSNPLAVSAVMMCSQPELCAVVLRPKWILPKTTLECLSDILKNRPRLKFETTVSKGFKYFSPMTEPLKINSKISFCSLVGNPDGSLFSTISLMHCYLCSVWALTYKKKWKSFTVSISDVKVPCLY